MKKALLAALIMLLAVSFTFANAVKEQQTQEVIHITLSDINNADSILGKGSLYIADLVKERTNGRIVIDTFLGGQLGTEEENVQNLRTGAVGITRINVANLQTRGIKVPEYTLFGLPYLLRSKEHAESYFYSEKGEALIGRIAEATDGEIYGLTGYIISTPRHFFAKKEVHSMADMAHMKVRCETTPMKIDMMTAFGMSGTPLGLNDMYSALQTGMIEGAEHNLTSIKSYAFYEQCPYILLTHNNYNANIYLISGKVVDSLSKEDLKIINECVRIACEKETADYPNDDVVIRAELEAKGVKFIEPNDIEVWQQAAQVLYQKYGAGYEDFIKDVLSYAK